MAKSTRAKAIERALAKKTIVSVNASAVNVIHLTLGDGTSAELEVEHMGHGLYGIVLGQDKVRTRVSR